MGNVAQRDYLNKYVPDPRGPILEIGALVHAINIREKISEEYMGTDLKEGPGVDFVQDLTLGTGEIPLSYFNLILCTSVLEHVDRPWLFAENVEKLLAPDGQIFISVPWVWRFHSYPSDYWRMSPFAVKILFSNLVWDTNNWEYSSAAEIRKWTKHADTKIRSEYEGFPPMLLNMLGRARQGPKIGDL